MMRVTLYDDDRLKFLHLSRLDKEEKGAI